MLRESGPGPGIVCPRAPLPTLRPSPLLQNGLNALHLAAKEGHVGLVQELLGRGSAVDSATKVGALRGERRCRSFPWRTPQASGTPGFLKAALPSNPFPGSAAECGRRPLGKWQA